MHLTDALKSLTKNNPEIRRVITANATRRTTVLVASQIGASNKQIQQLTAWTNETTLKIYLGKNLVQFRCHQNAYPIELTDYFSALFQVSDISRVDSGSDTLISVEKSIPKSFLELVDSGVED